MIKFELKNTHIYSPIYKVYVWKKNIAILVCIVLFLKKKKKFYKLLNMFVIIFKKKSILYTQKYYHLYSLLRLK